MSASNMRFLSFAWLIFGAVALFHGKEPMASVIVAMVFLVGANIIDRLERMENEHG